MAPTAGKRQRELLRAVDGTPPSPAPYKPDATPARPVQTGRDARASRALTGRDRGAAPPHPPTVVPTRHATVLTLPPHERGGECARPPARSTPLALY